jgi:hypothetical protein
MVRNPVDMAPSLHGEMLLSGDENEPDFARAWFLQDKRRQGLCIPASYSWAKRRLLYGEACSLGAQIDHLLKTVSPQRVLILVLDDLKAAPRTEYLRVLEFLGVPDDGRAEFPMKNQGRALRSITLQKALCSVKELKHRLGFKRGFGLWSVTGRAISTGRPRPQLSSAMRRVLAQYFQEDIEKLGKLLGRDFRCWSDPPERGRAVKTILMSEGSVVAKS